jgi:hypothetical protein
VATVWGLVSAVPALIRVPSQHYENSVWCRREHEILEYLRVDDFLPERYLIEVQEAQLPILDDALPSDTGDATNLFARSRFPHLTSVFRLFPYEPWECRLLACAAAVRFTFLKLRDRDLTGKDLSSASNRRSSAVRRASASNQSSRGMEADRRAVHGRSPGLER